MNFSDFIEVKLKDITIGGKGSYGIGAPAVDYKESLYTYLRITDITDEGTIIKEGLKSVDDKDASNYLLEKNDIVFARTGNSTGRAYFYDERDGEFVYAGFLIKFKLDESKVNPKYIKLYTLTNDYKSWVKSFATGSTRNNINAKMYGDMIMKLPRRNIQDQIVDVIEPLNDKIRINNQMNETLEEMAQALFKRWFVDFEFPNEEGHPYKSSGGEMIESELGMIPKGWKNSQLEDICSYSSNKIIIENLDNNNYISTENMLPNKGGIIEASNLPTTSKVTSFNNGDTLISNIRPYFKKIYYCNQSGGCSNDVLCFNPKLKDYTYCLYLYLYEDNFFDYMMAGSKGTKMPRGDKKQIMRYPIVIADRDIYIKFNEIVSPIFEKMLTLKEENKNLISLRDTLLPKLMSGEIRVSDLES